ncbi:MAG: bis(5'-nucleosyl)-tetraphosphatase (symmetrical) YqeK [Spirochaetia bacterium]|nr:bis(5'-nucleosyl)-tetraphosphatase (symmetrical) YqeK [Spirochaetia bacterium]
MDFQHLEANILQYLNLNVKESRKQHSLRTAEMAVRLCERFEEDPKSGYIAGIAHDMMKDMPLDLQWQYAERLHCIPSADRFGFSLQSRPAGASFLDKIVHGPASAVYIFETWEVANPDILEAIACHASAAKTMCPLAKILYIADKLEPGRAHVSETLRFKIDSLTLDELFFLALESVVSWLRLQNASIAQTTLDLYNNYTTKAGR